MNMENSTRKESHSISADILDDLASRFIINVPDEERSNFIRICFQIELAHWFYLDFYCNDDNKSLAPCGIKQFAHHIFNHIPFLSIHAKKLDDILSEWKQYKMTVPTYGAILLTSDLKHVLLVQSYWAKSSWGFPKGKVNENEEPLHCAIREVYEETGYDISKLSIEEEFIEGVLNYQYTRLYLIRNVPIETIFVPRTRKEIKYCEWFCVDHLPVHKNDQVSKTHLGINANSFFMIMPFVKRLKKWITDRQNTGKYSNSTTNDSTSKKALFNGTNKTANNMKNGQTINNIPSGSNSPRTVFFKNNASHRQRHKSLGDIDCQITNNSSNESTGEDAKISILSAAKGSSGAVKMVQNAEPQPYCNVSHIQDRRPDLNNSNESTSPNISKRKFFAAANAEKAQKSAQPIDAQKNRQTIQVKQNCREYPKQKIEGEAMLPVGLNYTKRAQKKVYKLENGTHQMTISPNWMAVSNTPQFARILQDEPNIKNWLNIQLNKDIIFKESLKVLL